MTVQIINSVSHSLALLFVFNILGTAIISVSSSSGHGGGTSDFSCFDIFNIAYIGDIPHPTNCNVFAKCIEESPGIPTPVLFNCPPELNFNFDACDCNFPDISTCYDPNNSEHISNTFKCARPLVSGKADEKCVKSNRKKSQKT